MEITVIQYRSYNTTVRLVENNSGRVSSHVSLSFVVVNVTFHTKQTNTEKATAVNQPFIN
jgi:hypothetical protein